MTMKPVRAIAVLVGLMLGGAGCFAVAQEKVDLGKREYDANCAVCHGQAGRGDGPYGIMGKGEIGAADLTTLAKRNGGVFPFARVHDFIDGTELVKAHGSREMPIWGQEYKVEGRVLYGAGSSLSELYVRARILALTEYVYRLQAR
jgi:mono/diheme cytochrome c family protein